MKCNSQASFKKLTSKNINQKLRDIDRAMNLPGDYPWQVLTKLVNDLQYTIHQDDFDLITGIIRDRDIESYLLLDEHWGLQSINTQCEDILPEIRAKYQIAALLKKFRFETSLQQRVDSAKKKFKNAEDACGEYNHGGYLKLVKNGEFPAFVLTHARNFLRNLLGDIAPTKSSIVDWSRHGPGSTLGTRNGLVSTYHKYLQWPYTTTASALPVARFLIQSNKRWLGALEDSYRNRYNIPKTVILDQSAFWENVFEIVPGNRITTVPKNALTERTIAIEPTINLMLQLGVDGFIRKRLKRWDIDLDSQKKNQDLAYSGSITGDYVTFDLSAASDMISLKLCQLLLPPEWYTYLMKIRSPQGSFDGEEFFYEKISSMGNGYTFALESAIFAALCSAAIIYDEGSIDYKTDLCIFGDDIIVKAKNAKSSVDALSIAGFKLNHDKSFFDGPVRESCGCDWYMGKPVRPVFLSETPKTVSALLVDRNRLKRQLQLNWGLEETNVVGQLDSWIPEFIREYFRGPLSDESFDSYLHDEGFWNKTPFSYGCFEYIRLVFRPKEVPAKEFLFRKLMHDLKGDSVVSNILDNSTTGGSRFIPTQRGVGRMSVSYSRTDYWCGSYHFLKNPKKLL